MIAYSKQSSDLATSMLSSIFILFSKTVFNEKNSRKKVLHFKNINFFENVAY